MQEDLKIAFKRTELPDSRLLMLTFGVKISKLFEMWNYRSDFVYLPSIDYNLGEVTAILMLQ